MKIGRTEKNLFFLIQNFEIMQPNLQSNLYLHFFTDFKFLIPCTYFRDCDCD